MSVAIRVGGRWLEEYGPWAKPILTYKFPLGCWELTWEMSQGYSKLGTKAAPVEVFLGASPIWAGHLPVVEPSGEDDTTTFTALGVCREGEGTACLTASGWTTSRPRTAAQQAINRGVLSWRDVTALPTSPFVDPDTDPSEDADETAAVNYLGALLDAWAEESDLRWGVDGYRDVWTRSDPTMPDFYVTPGVQALGHTLEAQAGSLIGRYISKETGKLATVTVGDEAPERLLDLTALGRLSPTQATNRLNSLYRKIGSGATGWKNGFSISPHQILTPGQVAPHLGHVAEACGRGVMVRIAGQDDPRHPGVGHIDAVVGEAVWDVTENTLDLAPIETDSDDFDSILSSLGISVVL